LRFSVISKLLFIACLVTFALGPGRAQAAGDPDPSPQQPASLAPSEEMNPSQLANESASSQSIASPENNALAPDESSFGNHDLPDVPAAFVSYEYVPLTADGRWRNFWKDTMLSPLAYVGALGGALGNQLSDQPREWGDGFSGYAKRAGVNVLQFTAQESIHQGGAALMHTDPRYLPCRCDGGFRRTWYALKMSFLTYRDNGTKTLDLSQLAGAYGGAMIAESMYPSRYSPLVQGIQNGHVQVGANVAINFFREFSPELSRLNPFRHHAASK
jgi:hypothetical protein